MARFRRRGRTGRRSFGRAVRHHSRKSGFGGQVGSIALGTVGAVAYEKFVSGLIPIQNPMLHNAIDLGIGYFASKKGGFIGNTGKAVMYINAYAIAENLMSGINIGSIGTSTTAQGSSW